MIFFGTTALRTDKTLFAGITEKPFSKLIEQVKKIGILAFVLVCGMDGLAQTIDFSLGDGCNFGTFTKDGSQVNGRNAYSGDNLTVTWSGSQWEVNVVGGPLLYSSTVATTPNPPTTVGNFGQWAKLFAGCGSSSLTLTGSGTQNSLALPIELVSFSASMVSAFRKLNWATASEKNNAGFEVERSMKGPPLKKLPL